MIPLEHAPLWDKIEHFPIDDATAERPFSAKLAASQQWSAPFTQKAIEEYRKFIFLCCILEGGAAPSKVVDEVWHLHLTYTRSYWIELCKETLGKDIHHNPSMGGLSEDKKHRDWYAETLRSYREVFETEAPGDVWPAAEAGGEREVIPARIPFVWDVWTIAAVAVMLAPFLFIWGAYHTINPFTLGGPHFLVFFPVFAGAFILAYVLFRLQIRKRLKEVVEVHFPADVSVFQIADLLYGKHRALQAAVVQLMQRGLLELQGGKSFLIRKGNYVPEQGDRNPLIPAFEQAADGTVVSYEEMVVSWYDQWKFSHPALEVLGAFCKKREPFWATFLCPAIVLVVALARMVQGSMNGRPIGALVQQSWTVAILFVIAVRLLQRKTMVPQLLKKILSRRLADTGTEPDRLAGQYALEGAPALGGFAEGVMLTTLFSGYAAVGLLGSFSGASSSGSDGGSSCGSSSCGGSSCGGCSGGD